MITLQIFRQQCLQHVRTYVRHGGSSISSWTEQGLAENPQNVQSNAAKIVAFLGLNGQNIKTGEGRWWAAAVRSRHSLCRRRNRNGFDIHVAFMIVYYWLLPCVFYYVTLVCSRKMITSNYVNEHF